MMYYLSTKNHPYATFVVLMFSLIISVKARAFEIETHKIQQNDGYSTFTPAAPADSQQNLTLDSRQLLTDIKNHRFAAWGMGVATVAVACALTWEFPCQIFYKILKPNRADFFNSINKSKKAASSTELAKLTQKTTRSHAKNGKLASSLGSKGHLAEESTEAKKPFLWIKSKIEKYKSLDKKAMPLQPTSAEAMAVQTKRPVIKVMTEEAEMNYALARESYLQALDTQINLDLEDVGAFIKAYAIKSKRKTILDFRRFEAKLPANMAMWRMRNINDQLKELKSLMQSSQLKVLTDEEIRALNKVYSNRRKKLLTEYKTLKSWL